ncbi:MAG: flagellar M-ring protein FliF C-terminal domain-containing protein, partial [Elusimicrobiota bacterium]
MRTLLLILALLPLSRPSPVWATTEETEAGMRLTAEATEFLDQLLGPGKAKVLVTVQGEHSETRTQSETTTPIKRSPNQAPPVEPPEEPTKFLPGYSQNPTPVPKPAKEKTGPDYDYLQKDQEQTLRQSGLIIKMLHATVILDSSVPEAQKSVIRQVMPDLMRLDANRGDIL